MRESYTFKQIAQGVWSIEGDRYDKGVHAQLRMVILPVQGGLLLHSPVPLDDGLASQLATLGEVRHLVAPNLNHHFFAKAAKQRYPNATLWGAPGLTKKQPLLGVERELESGQPFGEGLEVLCLRGVPFSNECVFRHAASGSFICTDMVQNVQQEEHFFTRQLWRMIGVWKRLAQNRYWRFKTEDKAAARQTAQQLLAWNLPRVIMAHGVVVEEHGASLLREATAWLDAR